MLDLNEFISRHVFLHCLRMSATSAQMFLLTSLNVQMFVAVGSSFTGKLLISVGLTWLCYKVKQELDTFKKKMSMHFEGSRDLEFGSFPSCSEEK